MEYRFVVNNIKIKSSWFEDNGKFSVIGDVGFRVYIELFRHMIDNQDDVRFNISLKHLRRYMGLTKKDTVDVVRLLVKNNIIWVDVLRWDRVTEHDLLEIVSVDYPNTTRINKSGDDIDDPVTSDDLYVSVDLQLMQHYLDLGFSGNEMGLYCLLRSLSNNTERKSWMSIHNIARCLGLSRDKVMKMIRLMNKHYLLLSKYKKQEKNQDWTKFEHVICPNFKGLSEFNSGWIKREIDHNLRLWGEN